MARQDTSAQRLMRLIGIGETTATAIVTSVGNGATATSSLAADSSPAGSGWCSGSTAPGARRGWAASPGRATAYLRAQPAGDQARAVLAAAPGKSDSISLWAVQLAEASFLTAARGCARIGRPQRAGQTTYRFPTAEGTSSSPKTFDIALIARQPVQ